MEHWTRLGWIVVDENEVLVFDGRKRKPTSAFDSFLSNDEVDVDEQTRRIILAAAAPDLLGACREGLSFMESVIEFDEMRGNTTPPDVVELRDRFAAVLAKAKGELESC